MTPTDSVWWDLKYLDPDNGNITIKLEHGSHNIKLT